MSQPLVLPLHIGVFIQGCASETSGGVALPALIGPMIEELTEVVAKVTIVAHDPPPIPSGQEEVADFFPRPRRGAIDVVSLGPQGTWRDFLKRRRRVRDVVRAESWKWDLAIFRLPNRRADTFYAATRSPRLMAIVLGYAPGVAKATAPGLRKVVQQLNAWRTEATTRAILGRCGVVVFNSEEVARVYRTLVPDPMMEPWSMRRERDAYLAEDRLNGSVVNVVVCSRLTETKGVFEALDAFARLRGSRLPQAQLHVIGEGDARAEMEKRTAPLGVADACTFHGWIPAGPQLFELLRSMDVMLHLSYAEGFPQIIWEALANSVLVVCTPVGGIPRSLSDRKGAMFVPVHEADGAVRAVEELLDDPELRTRLIRRGYDRARDSSVEAIVSRMTARIATTWPELMSNA